jgi:SHS2 domain-containing protein
MERYKFLEHTADAKFQAFGRTLEEAFSNAALATARLMWDWENVEKRVENEVKVKGNDLKQLLANFLEEIIYLFETKSFLLGNVEKLTIKKEGKGFGLKAVLKGDRHSDKYKIHGDVKAITYNEMEVETKNHFMIQVVVDI